MEKGSIFPSNSDYVVLCSLFIDIKDDVLSLICSIVIIESLLKGATLIIHVRVYIRNYPRAVCSTASSCHSFVE